MAQALRASQISQLLSLSPGAPIPELASRLFAYYLARAYDHETSQDSGTYLRNVFMALVKFGFPPESFWPYSDDSSPGAKFTIKPTESVFSQAFDQNKQNGTPAYYRIDTTGNERLLDIRRAIAAGHCVVFGTQVSEDFCSGNVDASKPLPPPIGKAIAGGHALTIGEYANDDDYGIVNSWGDQVGKGGWFRFSGEYLAWDESNDFWIVSAAPQFSRSAPHISP